MTAFTFAIGGNFVIDSARAEGPFTFAIGGNFVIEDPPPPAPDCFLFWNNDRVACRGRIFTADGRFP